jgi:hypothetical protein
MTTGPCRAESASSGGGARTMMLGAALELALELGLEDWPGPWGT